MASERWLLVDTETTGLRQPIHAVEVAAQLMEGWQSIGESFRRLINVQAEIPSEVSRIHGYTKEILERDGYPPTKVYKELFEYADGAPICSYNINYDYDEVLIEEWTRLGIKKTLPKGFCLLRLAQRLLDPVPAGNHKLQTLRQFYRLPERGAHTALGDVNTVLDLMDTVLKPLAVARGLHSIKKLKLFTEEQWFQSKLTFGKHKGRSFRDAHKDRELRAWIEWLSESENQRSREMGIWYLSQLNSKADGENKEPSVIVNAIDSVKPANERGSARSGIVIFNDIKVKQLKALIGAARERLADLEMMLDRERLAVAKTQAELFSLLKDAYRERDQLILLINFRKKYLNSLMAGSDLEPEDIRIQYKDYKQRQDDEYESAVRRSEEITSITEAQQNELKDLYRKLVKIYHPDRVIGDESKVKAFGALMAIINQAKAKLDIQLMREIANDPAEFMRKHNLGELQQNNESDSDELKRLYDSLQSQILETIAKIDEMRSSPQYDIYKFATRRPDYISEVAEKYRRDLDIECSKLTEEARALKAEIDKLQGDEDI